MIFFLVFFMPVLFWVFRLIFMLFFPHRPHLKYSPHFLASSLWYVVLLWAISVTSWVHVSVIACFRLSINEQVYCTNRIHSDGCSVCRHKSSSHYHHHRHFHRFRFSSLMFTAHITYLLYSFMSLAFRVLGLISFRFVCISHSLCITSKYSWTALNEKECF